MHNIISNILDKIAELWRRAIKYQIFIILAAIALLVILIFSAPQTNNKTGIVMNMLIFCTAAIGGYLAFKLKGSQLAALTFVAALLLRLCLIFVLENSTPFMRDNIRVRTTPWIKHYDSILFEADEFFYFYNGQMYRDVSVSEFISSPEFNEHSYRMSFLLSRIFRYFGDEAVWARLTGAVLGAFAAAITALGAERLFSMKTASIVSAISALAPQTALYSVRFLKENWVIFAVSLIVLGFAMIVRNKKLLLAMLPITAASVFLIWIRLEYGLIFIVTIPIVIYFRYRYNPAGKIVAVMLMALIVLIISFYQFNKLTYKAETMVGKYNRMERGQRGRIETVEILDKTYKSHSSFRLLNVPLSLLNPPPRNLHHLYTKENKFYDTVLLSNIYQWWLPLPFLIIGAVVIISNRTDFLGLLTPYIIALIASAMLLGGLQPNLLRYRGSLAPITFIIIGVGVESFIALPNAWKNKVIMAVYAAFIILAVYFYIGGF